MTALEDSSVGAAVEGPRPARARLAAAWLPALAVALLGVALLSLGSGASSVGLGALLSGEPLDPTARTILWQLRLPRLLLGVGVGAGLAVCGAVMQGLFRNPLADPSLIGVSSGAALGAALGILAAARIPGLPQGLQAGLLPVGACLGGLFAVVTVHRLATRGGRTVVITLLLSGLAIEALSRSGTGLVTFLADDRELRDLSFWLLGSLGGATWPRLMWVAPIAALGFWLVRGLAPALDALLLGEAEAGHVGVDVEKVKRRAVALTTLLVGSAVALAGVIGFVGLVVPHVVRLALGPSHRRLLPASALVGATLVTGADVLARTAAAPAEIPIGVVTAVLGAPFFLHLLRRTGQRASPC